MIIYYNALTGIGIAMPIGASVINIECINFDSKNIRST
jgi:hypothetical protein